MFDESMFQMVFQVSDYLNVSKNRKIILFFKTHFIVFVISVCECLCACACEHVSSCADMPQHTWGGEKKI